MDLQELKSIDPDGTKLNYVHFYGGRRGDEITKSCFSQWYDSSISFGLHTYKTAEHWMMAQKARLFEDEISFDQILAADTPRKAKTLGRSVENFNPEVWEFHCRDIVYQGNYLKFTQDNDLCKFIQSFPVDSVFVEASPYDRIWGIGMSEEEAIGVGPKDWKGTNLLGFVLMDVQSKLLF